MPTPANITTPPTGLPLSQQPAVTTVAAGTLVLASQPKAGGGYESVNLPAELLGNPLLPATPARPDGYTLTTDDAGHQVVVDAGATSIVLPADPDFPAGSLFYLYQTGTREVLVQGGQSSSYNGQAVVQGTDTTPGQYRSLRVRYAGKPGGQLDVYECEALGGGAGTLLDVYEVPQTVRDAVRAAGSANTWAYGDLTAYNDSARQAAGAPPAVAGQPANVLVGTASVQAGDTFDAFELGSTTVAWRYTYCRRNDGTLGWTRIPKTA